MTGEFPAQRSSNAEMFPFDDVFMNSADFNESDISLVKRFLLQGNNDSFLDLWEDQSVVCLRVY